MMYKHKEKGGAYKLIGKSRGAGTMRGVELIVYQCLRTGNIYHRKKSDFESQMEEVPRLNKL